MKISLDQFDKAFENRIRLQIMSVLVANESYDFNSLKELLELTDGNLASHLKALEKEEYMQVQKSFIGRKPNTRYSGTEKGRAAFKKHLQALEDLENPFFMFHRYAYTVICYSKNIMRWFFFSGNIDDRRNAFFAEFDGI